MPANGVAGVSNTPRGDAMTTCSVSNGKLRTINDQADTETFRKSDF